MRILKLCLVLGIAAGCCRTEPAVDTAAAKELRPAFRPGPSAGELFEGPIRVHTRGGQGDALGCDVSPLGDLLAFSWNDHQDEPKIYVVPTAGGPPRQVTFGGWPDVDPEFAPGSDPASYRIAYASRRDGNFDICLVALSGSGGAWQLTSEPADERHPSFSPDGRNVAFARLDRDGIWKIWRKDLTTQQEVLLGPGTNPEWSPDGESIAFQLAAGREERLWSVWVMRADGTARTQLVADETFGAIHPAWSPDGRFLAVTRIPVRRGDDDVPPAGDIAAYDLRTGALFKLTTAEALNTDPCWALDGWVYFSSSRTTGRFNLLSGKPSIDVPTGMLAEEPLLPRAGAGR